MPALPAPTDLSVARPMPSPLPAVIAFSPGSGRRDASSLLALVVLLVFSGCATPPPALHAQDGPLPFTVSRLVEPGPMTGAVARIELSDPRVSLHVALADEHDPDGDGPCTGQLETPSQVARRKGFALTLNASFFSAPQVNLPAGRKARYVVGNCGTPSGFHASDGRLLAAPAGPGFRSVFVVDEKGRPDILDGVQALPPGTREAVSGNVLVLRQGEVVKHGRDTARHPRSVVGLSRDRRVMFLVAVDGRQPGSNGATYAELGELLHRLGAWDALNLDGGGSTAFVIQDPYTGAQGLLNRPSDGLPSLPWQGVERPVIDVIGVRVDARGR